MSRTIQPNLTNWKDETTYRGQAMAALIKQYLNIDTEFGLRTIGDNPQQTYPCIFVQPNKPDLATTGKFEINLAFSIFWYVVDNSPVDIVSLAASIGHALEKLFSNNALNDLGTAAPPSHSFYGYEPYWTDITDFNFKVSPTLKNPTSVGGAWMRMGMATINIRTWIIR